MHNRIMESKSAQIRKQLLAGNDRQALRIAAKFFDRSDKTSLYKRAHESQGNPQFYKQLGVDVELLYTQAITDLRERFLNDHKNNQEEKDQA